jgi:benzil reductase ((S)-benzoin forming)
MAGVFITGVSSGIGHALAKRYMADGWEVFGVSRREPKDLLETKHFRFRSLDLSHLAEIEAGLRELFHEVNGLELTILNAGVLGPICDLADTTIDEMKRVFDLNLWANKAILDALFRMRIQLRRVVTMSSGAAVHAGRGWNAYSISKAALNRLTALYAAEHPHTHFCALAPGIIDTAMQDQIAALPDDKKFASFDRLKQAKGTELMPPPDEAAARLVKAIENAPHHPSGEFLSIDDLVKRTWI